MVPGAPHIILYEAMRHSTATDMLRRGVPERVIREWLGHSRDSYVTQRYARPAKRVAFLDAMRPEDVAAEALDGVKFPWLSLGGFRPT